ncbi:MAG TPA: hypothetical protein ACFYEK_12825 [Candidatus Wunengus sp. YC60]|uniref:hypothetical protein n=1 Tax=Candidatus Wunengus sp. YC60 TaxID=3367697 RepID=UPI004029F2A0
MQKHLKDKQYYIDLYDCGTVERCRRLIELHSKPRKNPVLVDGKEPPKEWVDAASQMAREWNLMFEKGGRYIHKEETISKWIADDEERDRYYEAARETQNIRCLKCRAMMHFIHKDLWTELNKPHRVLFMFECPNKCVPRRAFWDNGDEWISKPDLCPKCRGELKVDQKVTEEKFITDYKCASCGFTKIDELERTANKKEEPDPNFEADRAKFCLSKEEGEKWRQELVNMEQMQKLVDEFKERDKNKELYDKVAELKKLTVIDLGKLLAPALEKDGYVQLQLGNPEIDRIVAVPFTVQDSKSGRESLASEYDLKRLLKKTLEDTNWRLMSDGASYRLGILSGRLRGYENEEELVKLVSNGKNDAGN